MAAGDCEFYSADIAGFDGTVTDIQSAGWTRITGTNDLGQSATKLAILTNGLVRVVLDKNNAVEGGSIYAFNGAEYVKCMKFTPQANEVGKFATVGAVSTNAPSGVRVTVTMTATSGAVGSYEFRVTRGIPSAGVEHVSGQNFSPTIAGAAGAAFKTILTDGITNGIEASDNYGLTAHTTGQNGEFYVIPLGDAGVNVLWGVTDDGSSFFHSTGFPRVVIGASLGREVSLGAVPMTYTTPSTLDAEIGNTDGQLIEAESFYAWEGETPLIGTNLLTNGGFETDLTGWTQTNGTWTRVTTQKKFGTASVETSSNNANLDQDVTVVAGDTYAATCWIRTADVNETTDFNLQIRESGATLANSATVGRGLEWTYLQVIFTPATTTVTVRLREGSVGALASPVQFDGIQLIKVKDAAGVSALAFDTTSTTGWALGANASNPRITDAPRGKAFTWDTNTAGGAIDALLTWGTPADLTAYKFASIWVRTTVGGAGPRLALRNGVTSEGPVAGSPSSSTANQWTLVTFDISSMARDQVDRVVLYHVNTLTARTEQFGSIRLSKHNPAIGQKHGILHDMGDAEGLAGWWKINDDPSSTYKIQGATNNGNLDAWTGGNADDWALERTPTVTEETTLVRTGSAAKIVGPGGGIVDSGLEQTFVAEETGVYRFTAWARTGGTAGHKARLRVRSVDPNSALLTVDGTAATTTYEKLTGTVDLARGESYVLQLLAAGDADTVYFDDAEFVLGVVENGGFETYTTSPGVPDSWSDLSGGNTTFARETTIKRTGSNAAKMTANGSEGASAGGLQQTISGLTSGKSYLVEAWVRTAGVAGEAATLLVRNSTDVADIGIVHSTDASTTFEKLSFTMYVDGGDSYSIRVVHRGVPASGDIIYVDDISVKEIVATDSSGNANTGTPKGALNTAGPTPGAVDPFGGTGAWEFDGVDDYVSVPDADILDGMATATFEAWIYPDTVAAGNADIINKSGVYAFRRSTATFVASIPGLTGATSSITTGSVLNVSAWNHVVITYDGAFMRAYHNGVLVTTNSGSTGSIATNSNALTLGSSAGSTNFFDGRIAGVRVYDRALGADEVAQRYNAGTHEAVAGFTLTAGAGSVELTTDTAEGNKAILTNFVSPTSHFITYTFSSPQDWGVYDYITAWQKRTSATRSIRLVDADGTSGTFTSTIGAAGAHSFDAISLTDAAFASLDLTRIVSFGAGAAEDFTVSAFKLTSLNEVGDWRFLTNANSSGGYSIQSGAAPSTTTLAANDKFTVPVDVPNAGKYYVGVMAKATGSGGFIEATLDGVASGTPVAVPTTALNVQENQLLFGPFTVGAGERDLEIKVSTLGSMTAIEVDFMDLFPYEASGSTPAGETILFPKNLSNALLRDVTYSG